MSAPDFSPGPARSTPPLKSLDYSAFMRWAFTAVGYLADRQDHVNALNVFPVPDGDTGTNLLRTLSAALEKAIDDESLRTATLGERLAVLARDALLSARGNSGVILAQLLVGLAEGVADSEETVDAPGFAAAMAQAAKRAREGVYDPVEGTILTVAQALADASDDAVADGADFAELTTAMRTAGAYALEQTTHQLEQLAEAGVVDAGGAGLMTVVEALDDVVHHRVKSISSRPLRRSVAKTITSDPCAEQCTKPCANTGSVEYEVVYHLHNVAAAAQEELAEQLHALGNSVVLGGSALVAGRRELVTVHVHTNNVGAAICAAAPIGMPTDIAVEVLTDFTHETQYFEPTPGIYAAKTQVSAATGQTMCSPGLGIVVGASGEGIASLLREGGAQVVPAVEPRSFLSFGGRSVIERMEDAILGADTKVVLVLPGDPETALAAASAAVRACSDGIEVVVADTRSCVQGLAAVSVYDPDANPREEAHRLAAVAASVRAGTVESVRRPVSFAVGEAHRGDLFAYADGDVRAVGVDPFAVSAALVKHLIEVPAKEDWDPELVTLVAGRGHLAVAADLADWVEEHYPGLEAVTVDGGDGATVLTVGVE